ncbi:MAG: DUF6527 family protein [Runella zeae]
MPVQKRHEDDFDFVFHCPGCGVGHGVWVNNINGPKWGFNGDMERPTFSPSIRVRHHNNGVDVLCHSFVTDGKIYFLDDCTHDLKGYTVDMEDI